MSSTTIARAMAPLRIATTLVVSVVVSVFLSLMLLISYAVLAVLFNLGSIGIGVATAIIKMLCLTVIVSSFAVGRLLWSGQGR